MRFLYAHLHRYLEPCAKLLNCHSWPGDDQEQLPLKTILCICPMSSTMRIVSFGEAPTPNAPRRRVIEQDSSPAGKGTMTKLSTTRRRSVLANSLAPASAKQGSDRKGKGRAIEPIHSEDESSQSTRRASSVEDDTNSLKENDGREELEGTVKDVAMDLVTSTSTGSMMHQAMEEAAVQSKKPRRRKAARRVPLHGESAS